jgi:putative ABC transport system substrate-binding protein
MSYVQGEDRGQAALLPAAIEDYVAADASVRVIDVFVDGLDVRGLRFGRSVRAATGQLNVVNIDAQSNIDNIYAALADKHTDAVVVGADPMFWSDRDQLVGSAARRSLPAMYFAREFVAAGGLISYNSNLSDSIRKAGTYAGRILKGEKPADLPVLQPTKFVLVINLKTAKSLGITVPQNLIVAADEVIE